MYFNNKSAITTILLVLFTPLLNGQSCLPEGITFQSQEEINDFQTDYPACTFIEGNLQIQGDEISSLQGLSNLTGIGGRLRFYSVTALEDLSGLENLDSIGGDLDIYTWPGKETSLSSLSGLNSLRKVGGDFKLTGSDKLTNMTGLERLEDVYGEFNVSDNSALVNFTGLSSLKHIGGQFYIGNNSVLEDFSGLDSLETVAGTLNLYENNTIEDFKGLTSLKTIGGSLQIQYNHTLISLEGLDELEHIEYYFSIYENTALTSLTGPAMLDASSIDELTISGNSSLAVCEEAFVCTLLAERPEDVIIEDNASGCLDEVEVKEACLNALDNRSANRCIKTFPNPVQKGSNIHFNSPTKIHSLSIFTLSGVKIVEQDVTYSKEINTSVLPAGIYFIAFKSSYGNTLSKIIIQ